MSQIVEIHDLTLPELIPYACTSEVQLLRYFEPKPGIFIAESSKVVCRALDAGYHPLSMLIDRKKIAGLKDIIDRCGYIPIYSADEGLLTQITGFHLTQGVLCAMRRRELPDANTICSGAARIAVLEEIMNQTNVGAIFRSAAALNMDAVLLTSGCCDPLYRRSIRVSMGNVFQVPWTFLDSKDTDYVDKLKSMGFSTAAMALRDDSVGIDNPRLMAEEKIALIFGTEGEGLKDTTIDACDYVIKIPMAHGVDSLNVAAASAVAFWQLGKR